MREKKFLLQFLKQSFHSSLMVLLLIPLISMTAFSQNLFVENFNYPVRDSLESIGGWDRTGANTPYNVKILSSGLAYPEYLGSGIGKSAGILNHDNGDACHHYFNEVSSGNVYMSFLLRVDSLSSTSTFGFNICFDHEGGSTNLHTSVPSIHNCRIQSF